MALPDIPFDPTHGTVPNDAWRVLEFRGGQILPGLYATGWVKRGPSGVIGTNKPDAAETVRHLLEDAAAGRLSAIGCDDRDAVPRLLAKRGVHVITHDDWKRVDAMELRRGARQGRPRIKFTSLEECLAALRNSSADSSREKTALPT